jgi:hypothetical protein
LRLHRTQNSSVFMDANTELLAKIIDLMRESGVKVESPYDFENWVEDHAHHSDLRKTKRFTDSEGE